MTEDIPLEITSSGMANLPIFIAVLIVAAVVVRVYFSIQQGVRTISWTAPRRIQASCGTPSGSATRGTS